MANKVSKTELNTIEAKNVLRYAIKNNLNLASKGKQSIAYEIEGMPGIAKTSIVKQLSQEFDHHYVRLNLAEIDVCDLVGLPIYEYEVVKNGESRFVSDKVLQSVAAGGWEATGVNRTGYSKPTWIHGKEDKPVILCLDDYNRTTPMMTNACMTLIAEQRYATWGLPLGSSIILTCNPSDQDFFVQSEDSAQETRRLKLYMKADVDIWASEFAEGHGVDGRCINFLLSHKEIIEGTATEKKDGGKVLAKGNLRLWTLFFDSISGIKDFEKELDLIMNLGMGSIPEEHILQLATFIRSGLDKIPSPEDLLTKDLTWGKTKLKECIKEGKEKRQDIAAVITKRLLNYVMVNQDSIGKPEMDRYMDLMEDDILSEDIVLLSVRKLATIPKFKKVMVRPGIINKLI